MSTTVKPDPYPENMTPQEAADYIGVSLWTVRRWMKTGMLPFMQPSGRTGSILLAKADLRRFLDAATMPATTGPLFRGGGGAAS
jgi:excisionase family DNA binding protein